MDKQQLAEDYAQKKWRRYGGDTSTVILNSKEDYISGYEAANIEQEKIKAKIETLTKFRYRSYESIEEELNNLKNSLQND